MWIVRALFSSGLWAHGALWSCHAGFGSFSHKSTKLPLQFGVEEFDWSAQIPDHHHLWN